MLKPRYKWTPMQRAVAKPASRDQIAATLARCPELDEAGALALIERTTGEPTFRFPFGWTKRDVDYSSPHKTPGMRQRAL